MSEEIVYYVEGKIDVMENRVRSDRNGLQKNVGATKHNRIEVNIERSSLSEVVKEVISKTRYSIGSVDVPYGYTVVIDTFAKKICINRDWLSNDDGVKASGYEIERWRKGKENLFASSTMFEVRKKLVDNEPSHEELDDLASELGEVSIVI